MSDLGQSCSLPELSILISKMGIIIPLKNNCYDDDLIHPLIEQIFIKYINYYVPNSILDARKEAVIKTYRTCHGIRILLGDTNNKQVSRCTHNLIF